MYKLTHQNTVIEYSIREHPRTKAARVRVSADRGVEVVVPRGYASKVKHVDVIRQHADWILQTLQKVAQHAPTLLNGKGAPPEERAKRHPLYDGALLPLLDGRILLRIERWDRPEAGASRFRPLLDHRNMPLTCYLPNTLDEAQVPTVLYGLLEQVYRQAAKEIITKRVRFWAEEFGLKYKKVVFRQQKTRLASCSTTGTLSFNWQLIRTPVDAMDYVIIHELCHLTEMNHSARFWALVARRCPEYEYWIFWFKRNLSEIAW
jgi:predicted metal-dependent hydrolase